MATNSTKTTAQTKTTTESKPVIETNSAPSSKATPVGIQKTIQENTPAFVSNGINIATNGLESFRLNYFNSSYIFYPLLAFIVFLILRHLWRRFF